MVNKKNEISASNIKKVLFFVILGAFVTIIGMLFVFMDGLANLQEMIISRQA